MLAVITEFQLHSWRQYGAFFLLTSKVTLQAKKAAGLVHFKINPITLRTVTVWKSQASMHEFMRNGAHLEAMKQSASFGSIRSASWETESVPSWGEATLKLNASNS